VDVSLAARLHPGLLVKDARLSDPFSYGAPNALLARYRRLRHEDAAQSAADFVAARLT
jgi:hypothetical protein